MTKDGKIFGKISIIDLLVVVAIVVAAAGVYMRFFTENTKNSGREVELEYNIEINAIRQGTIDALEMSKGGNVVDRSSGEVIGKLIDFEKKPAKSASIREDGVIINAEHPDRFDVVLTIEESGTLNKKGYFTETDKPLSTGSMYSIQTMYVSTSGRIIGIRETGK